MPAPLSAQVLLALVPVPFPVPSVYLCLCLSLICIINIDVLSPVLTCSLFCCHCLFSVRRPNELHSPRLKSLSRLILLYIDTYTTHLHTYRHIYSIGSCLGSVCKCNCNCSCSLWIMKDESTRLDLGRAEQFHCLSQFALNSIPVFLIPFSHFHPSLYRLFHCKFVAINYQPQHNRNTETVWGL